MVWWCINDAQPVVYMIEYKYNRKACIVMKILNLQRLDLWTAYKTQLDKCPCINTLCIDLSLKLIYILFDTHLYSFSGRNRLGNASILAL